MTSPSPRAGAWAFAILCALSIAHPGSHAAAPPADPLSSAWDDLAGDDAARAYKAVCVLADRPREAVPLLRARLNQVKGEDGNRLGKLIAGLDDEDFDAR